MRRHGGRILADQLAVFGCERVFLVPGESYLPVMDGLFDHPDIDVIVCRQEGGAAMMAEADGKLGDGPGVCLVTRAPGAANAAAGVHIARQDSTPMLLLIGQVERGQRGREAFQEVDLVQMFAPLAKWAEEVNDTARIPEVLSRAWHLATSGRPGPIVLVLPEDVLFADADVPDALPLARTSGVAASDCSHAAIDAVTSLLADAERPLLIAGGGGWSEAASAALAAGAERHALPVVTAFRRQDYLDNEHPCYAGTLGLGMDPRLAERVRNADLLLAVGTRLGEIATAGYTLLDVPVPAQALVHVHPDADELGRVYRPTLAVNATAAAFLALLADAPPTGGGREGRVRAARDDYVAFREPLPMPGDVQLGDIVVGLRQTLGDALICNGAGNYTIWVHRHHVFYGYRSQLAPTSGSMGYGLPAAVAAKLRCPEREVVCWTGDGCFLMHGQELATAVQYGANIIVLLVNNNMYGTIRMHQERHYPGRVIGTGLRNPDFVALARSYGAFAARVASTAEFAPALAQARASGVPALLELLVDPAAITPTATL